MATTRELRGYGCSMAVLCGALGALVHDRFDFAAAAGALWALGALGLSLALTSPARLAPMYRLWMTGTRPLRWLVSHLALGLMFFGILTPIGWLLRLRGHDPLRLRVRPNAGERTLWTEVKPDDRPERAFQQF